MDYNVIYKSYDGLYKGEQLEKLNIIKKHINVSKKYVLLDIGCGTGISTNFFDCKSIGMDSCLEMLKKGCVCAKAEELPFKDNVFDIIISVTAIHNFDDPKKAINEIKRVSKRMVIITLLKRSNRFNYIKDMLNKSFKFRKINGNKDLIFIYDGN